jgi:hypothetical protein
MSSKNSVAKSLKLLGNVTMAHIKDVNKSGGSQWLSAINIAAQHQGTVRVLGLEVPSTCTLSGASSS